MITQGRNESDEVLLRILASSLDKTEIVQQDQIRNVIAIDHDGMHTNMHRSPSQRELGYCSVCKVVGSGARQI